MAADNGIRSSSKVAIIGSGFGGLGMGYYLKQAGIDSFTIFEKAADVGGTWRENTYPGAGCDIPSHFYSYSFEPHYPWAWRYAKQSEILDYARHCARKHGIQPHIRFNCTVSGADFDAARGLWSIRLASGEIHEAQFLVSGVGQLNRPAYPKLPGLDRFQGKSFHSAQWDHGFELTGKTVAVIGTGASAVQFVPAIVPKLKQLHVFQRSPGWTVPKVEKEFSPLERRILDRLPIIHDVDRARVYGLTELLAYAYNGHKWAEKAVTLFAKLQLWRQVRDPVLRRKLTPDYPIGCKRILLSNDWLPALARPNVEVVTEGIAEVNERGVRADDGQQRDVDAIIYSTGFAGTEFLAPMQIRGLDGCELREQWQNGAQAYLGMAISGFPNFFVLYGPNTNLGSGSIIFMLEHQQRYIVELLKNQQAEGWRYADLRADALAEFNREIRSRSEQTTFEGNCQSWYKTADGRNTNNWVGSMREYAQRTRQPILEHYERVAGSPAQPEPQRSTVTA